MKSILEFDLPEEREDFDLATNAINLKIVIDDLDNYLRAINKYGTEEAVYQSDAAKAAVQAVRDELNRLIKEQEIERLFY